MLIWLFGRKNYTLLNSRFFSSSSLRIGNVAKKIPESSTPWLIAHGFQKGHSPTIINHLKWLLQKDVSRQDVFLVGTPGPLARRIAMSYCEIAAREVEHLVISRDTTESDIKQRKEIKAGSSHYTPGPAVRAAVEGRVLLIEGIERAEQNLLPILNNLLENREMHLEDGRFLVAPSRYDSLHQTGPDLLRVHDDFWVIALGLPVPPFKGHTLDPPLRSRFQARIIDDLPFMEQKSAFLEEYTLLQEDKIHRVLALPSFLKETSSQQLGFPHLSSCSTSSIAAILNNLPHLLPYDLIDKVYPYQLVLHKDMLVDFQKVLTDLNIIPGVAKGQCTVKGIRDYQAEVVLDGYSFTVPSGRSSRTPPSTSSSTYIPTKTQEKLISDMIVSHSAADICLIGKQGCGKSVVIEEFAKRLGYETETVVLYNDMTARDLFQRRHTDEEGNTVWEQAPLVKAAVDGKLLVLDCVHQLHTSVISTLASLCEDRQIDLPDGTRLIAHDLHVDMCEKLHVSSDELAARGVLPIHPSFRIIATADEAADWLSPELLSLWHHHHHGNITPDEEKQVLLQCEGLESHYLELLQRTSHVLRSHDDPVISSVGRTLTLRQLLAIGRSVAAGASLGNAVHTALLTRFMPVLTRQTLTSTLESIDVSQTVDNNEISISTTDDTLTIGGVIVRKLKGDPRLIPSTTFYENQNQLRLLRDMLRSVTGGGHILLVGNQGVGKNKLVDKLLQLMEAPREYLQLHRDSTIQSITVQPGISDGKVVYGDSALVRAVRNGYVLVVDEADKASTLVTSVLRNLLDTGTMWLSDGRKIVKSEESDVRSDKIIQCHPNFRAIFLANRPGFPFLGNDFYAVMGDLLSCHAVDNPDPDSELMLLKNYGPDVPGDILTKLIGAFSELREMSDKGVFLYPYSTRELVNIVKHLQAFPEDGITTALCNVLDFEQQNGDIWDSIVNILHKHGIPFGATPIVKTSQR